MPRCRREGADAGKDRVAGRDSSRPAVLASGEKSSQKFLKVGIWNVLSLAKGNAPLKTLARQLEDMDMGVVGVCEHRLFTAGGVVADMRVNSYQFLYTSADKKEGFGVGFLVSQHVLPAVESCSGVSSRLATLRLKTRCGHSTIIMCHAPTNDKEDIIKDQFYDSLEQVLAKTPARDMVVLLGDFNAKLGNVPGVWDKEMGRVGPPGQMSDNGRRMLQMAATSGLVVTNTVYRQPRSRQWTWRAPDGHTAVKDYVLVRKSQKNMVRRVRACRRNDICSDHRMVVVEMVLRPQRISQTKPVGRFALSNLGIPDTAKAYQAAVSKAFKKKEGGSVETQWTQFKTVVLEAAEEHIGRKRTFHHDWMVVKTYKVLQAKGRALEAWRSSRTDKNRLSYLKFKKKAKLAVRQAKDRWWQARAQELEEHGQHGRQKELFASLKRLKKKTSKARSSIANKDGEVLSSQQEVEARWAQHFEAVLNPNAEVTAKFPPAPQKMEDSHHVLAGPPTDEEGVCVEGTEEGKGSRWGWNTIRIAEGGGQSGPLAAS